MIEFLTHPGLMNDPRNTGLIQAEVLYGNNKVKKALIHFIDDTQPLEKIYDDLVRSNSQYKIRGLGAMSITRLLAVVNHNCFTIDTEVLNQLARMGVCSQRSRRLTGREYSEIVKFFNPLMSIKMFEELGMELLHVILRNWDELLLGP